MDVSIMEKQQDYAIVTCERCRGFLESNGNRGTHADYKLSSNDNEESNDDDDSQGGCGKAKFGAIRAIIATSKFRDSLKRRRCAGLNRSKKLSLPIMDVRDAKEQLAVEELRRELISRNLLPEQHDDYRVLLRSVPHDLLPGISPCICSEMQILLPQVVHGHGSHADIFFFYFILVLANVIFSQCQGPPILNIVVQFHRTLLHYLSTECCWHCSIDAFPFVKFPNSAQIFEGKEI